MKQLEIENPDIKNGFIDYKAKLFHESDEDSSDSDTELMGMSHAKKEFLKN
eukprot:CAMPEP_0114674088 /NCGR_PEP_ID=MMETSP0191-20121206/45767_1 /TAXON_ID=126664 /ORGANISM="Sorites sp." /LENGTH=50 /DNA_ID=CAMNT_0001940499 /DNA_START=219 /DNA_END=368 /DNA_ORIENTATION=+